MASLGLAYFVTLCVSLVQFQVGAELICPSKNSSVIGVYFESFQNKTGDWQHSVLLSKRGLQRGNTVDKNDIPWNVDVGYQPILCDTDYDTLNVKISFTLRQILDTYKFYPGLGYYKYHATLDTWPVAKANCEKEGGHLAIINSQQEADALKQLVATDWAYIGLVKNDPKGDFFTIFGDPISKTGFSKWTSGVNPTNAVATHVGVLHKIEGAFSYSAQETKRPSICEHYL